MNLTYILAFLAVIFVLTYDTKTGRLEKFMGLKPQQEAAKTCCNNNDYMANNFVQCENAHYEGVQFANTNYGCPERHPQVMGGAIIGR